ncbi:hypothetical protein E2542_SST05196 [Spatholobus suberectus]|nr:hypothetical protein E2542_SST05196 [Spatholobus suberectus]
MILNQKLEYPHRSHRGVRVGAFAGDNTVASRSQTRANRNRIAIPSLTRSRALTLVLQPHHAGNDTDGDLYWSIARAGLFLLHDALLTQGTAQNPFCSCPREHSRGVKREPLLSLGFSY